MPRPNLSRKTCLRPPLDSPQTMKRIAAAAAAEGLSEGRRRIFCGVMAACTPGIEREAILVKMKILFGTLLFYSGKKLLPCGIRRYRAQVYANSVVLAATVCDGRSAACRKEFHNGRPTRRRGRGEIELPRYMGKEGFARY